MKASSLSWAVFVAAAIASVVPKRETLGSNNCVKRENNGYGWNAIGCEVFAAAGVSQYPGSTLIGNILKLEANYSA